MSQIEDYLARATSIQKAEFKRVRKLVYEVAPEAEESISYGMPAYKYKKKPLLYFGIFKEHMSIFPTGGITKQLPESLKGFKTSKGTIQFTEDNTLPENVIREVLLRRLDEINGKNK